MTETKKTRKALEAAFWKKTSKDYRGYLGEVPCCKNRAVMMLSSDLGTCLVPLSLLTDDQLR